MRLDPTELMRKASDTAHDYARAARDDAAQLFPDLTATERVPIIAAMVSAAAVDYFAVTMDYRLSDIAQAVDALT